MIEILPLTDQVQAKITAPPSKSHTLRALFTAALAEGETILKNPLLAQDQIYAIKALEKFGAKFEIKENEVRVQGTGKNLKLPEETVFIGNSGVSARFLIGVAALCPPGKIIIDGSERMRESRPIQDLLDAFENLGVRSRTTLKKGCPPVEVEGGSFLGGKTELKGNISSQYFSSILISAPYAQQDTYIKPVGELSSVPYIDVTIDVMKEFGVEVENNNYQEFLIKAGQRYQGIAYNIEGDYSNSSYFLLACAICGGEIEIENLKIDSSQGDKFFLEILERIGCQVKKTEDKVVLTSDGNLKPIKIDMNACPDLVPSLAVILPFLNGQSEIYNISQLRFKESDRIKAVVTELKKAGADIEEKEDGLIVQGGSQLHGAEIECYNDHRIAMAFSALGLKVPGMIIRDEKCVEKSFVNFYEVFQKIGGQIK